MYEMIRTMRESGATEEEIAEAVARRTEEELVAED